MSDPSSWIDASTGPKMVQQDHGFRYIPLRRASADGVLARAPLTAHPGNLPAGTGAEDRRMAEVCWSGIEADGDGLAGMLKAGWDVGVLVKASGLVVVDCDVKVLDEAGWVVTDRGSAAWSEGRRAHGIQDLAREVGRLGHAMEELDTYRVRTKSGGVHLYFRENPDYPLTTRHHRAEWRVDVIASENLWVAAPPTPGYAVEADHGIMELPGWLAVFLYGINETLPPLDAPLRAAWRELRARRGEWDAGAGMPAARPGEPLVERWARAVLEGVAASNYVGGWNNAIYSASRTLLDAGWEERAVVDRVMRAAAPTDERERRKALATIASAAGAARRGAR